MGIYIKLASPTRISPMEWALARIDYCYGAIRYFYQGKIFLPKTIEVWLNAPNKTLGGTKERSIPVTHLYKDVEMLRAWIKKVFLPREIVLVNNCF